MFTRSQAIELLHSKMQNINLRRHCYAAEASMRALYNTFEVPTNGFNSEREEIWALSGLLHDCDYEIVQKDLTLHTHLAVEWISELGADEELKHAILSHGWKYIDGNPEPSTILEWSLYCSDELTGLIVAVALVKEKKLENVSVDSVFNKWREKKFAAGANRSQIELCEEKLKIPLRDFIGIVLQSMQKISNELGL
ncbi:MAG: phosphohydrolase [Bacteroidetes bacterium]|nr:phosphohydrolase [Bacteroidota bacterium]